MSKTQDLLLDIAHEKNGYKIGEPWRFSEFSLCAVIPIIKAADQARLYRLLTESEKSVKLKDTGTINNMQVTNNSEYPILLKAGDILLGATQERVITSSQVVMQGETVTVGCACVHSTKGIRAGQTVKPGGMVPTMVRRAVYSSYRKTKDMPAWESSEALANDLYRVDSGYQGNIWGSVKSYSLCASQVSKSRGYKSSLMAMGAFGTDRPRTRPGNFSSPVVDFDLNDGLGMSDFANSLDYWGTPSEDLAGRLDETGKKFSAVIEKAPKITDQVGMCLVSLDGFDTLDLFDHPDSWEAIRKSILKSEASSIATSAEDSIFDYKPEKAKAIIRKLLESKFEEKLILDKPKTQTFVLTNGNLTGEVVTLNDKPIHFAVLKNS
jgi:hypothetical protein